KQTQFPKRQNEYNHRYSKRLQEFTPLLGQKNKPNQSQFLPNIKGVKAKTNPIQTQFQTSQLSHSLLKEYHKKCSKYLTIC
ncbi:MAG: hypothetical protein ACYS3N_16075, partial [Planctomycetota bacterium]